MWVTLPSPYVTRSIVQTKYPFAHSGRSSDHPSSGFCALIGGTLSDWFLAYSLTREEIALPAIWLEPLMALARHGAV